MPAMAATASSPTPKAQFYVIRGDGKFVPLVAMDELPNNLHIHDLPRSLRPEDTTGMISVGQHDSRHITYQIGLVDVMFSQFKRNLDLPRPIVSLPKVDPTIDVLPSNTKETPNQVDDKKDDHNKGDEINSNDKAIHLEQQKTETTVGTSTNKATSVIQSTTSITPKATTTTQTLAASRYASNPDVPSNVSLNSPTPSYAIHGQGSPVPSSATLSEASPFSLTGPDGRSWGEWSQEEIAAYLPNGKKVFCSHWCTIGNCSFAQQGCKYRHEMPMDVRVLERVGCRDVPSWFREVYGVGSLLAVPGSDAFKPRGHGRTGIHATNWRGHRLATPTKTAALPSTPRSAPRQHRVVTESESETPVTMKRGVATIRSSSYPARPKGHGSKRVGGTTQQTLINHVRSQGALPQKTMEQAQIELCMQQVEESNRAEAERKAQMAALKARTSKISNSNTQQPTKSPLLSSSESTYAASTDTAATTPNTSDAEGLHCHPKHSPKGKGRPRTIKNGDVRAKTEGQANGLKVPVSSKPAEQGLGLLIDFDEDGTVWSKPQKRAGGFRCDEDD